MEIERVSIRVPSHQWLRSYVYIVLPRNESLSTKGRNHPENVHKKNENHRFETTTCHAQNLN